MKAAAKLIIALLLVASLCLPALAEGAYTLNKVVILSRHNLRAPLSSNGSVPEELTPHEWINWTSNASELTLRGGVLETSFGQYFRKWLDKEGLIAENTNPEADEVRFYARDKQRCRLTARYFAAGMLPLMDTVVEHPGEPYNTEDFMKPALHFYSEEYAADATAQVAALGGDAGFEGLDDMTRDAISLIMDVADIEDSEIYQSGKYGDMLSDTSGYVMEDGKEPDITGPIKTACQMSDALILQYYEEPDALRAAFGHELTLEDWQTIGRFQAIYTKIRHGAPLVAINTTQPLIREMKSELENEKRKFTFLCAHDVTVAGVLSALGAEDYTLPESIEPQTPIGVKLVFEKWLDSENQGFYKVSLMYQSTDQIRNADILTLDNPPKQYPMHFEGVQENDEGMIAEADLIALFDKTLETYDTLEAKYCAPALDAAA